MGLKTSRQLKEKLGEIFNLAHLHILRQFTFVDKTKELDIVENRNRGPFCKDNVAVKYMKLGAAS